MDGEQLVDAWRIHARVTLYLLNGIPPAALSAHAPDGKGRTAGEMLAHLHQVRLMWLKPTPNLLQGLSKVEKDAAGDKAALKQALQGSAAAVETLIARAVATGSKVKGFKPHTGAFVGYLIAHESYHHGEIALVLGQAGYPLDKKVAYGMWEWGVR